MKITDHAIVRYLQRVKKIDMDKTREAILPKEHHKTIKSYGDGKYPVGNHRIVVKHGVVITVETGKK